MTLKLNSLFTDGLVLQANRPIRIFGEGAGTIVVTLGSTTADRSFTEEAWVLELPAMPYGGPYEMHIMLNGEKTVLRDVYIGDVYLIAGQSNMQLKFREMERPAEEYIGAPLLRLYTNPRLEEEPFSPEDGWVTATPETVGNFSAIGYLAGWELQETTGHAVGLITLYQGAAAIQCFIPATVFDRHPELVIPAADRFDMAYPWNEKNGILFDLNVLAIAPFSVGGVIWYQGESNCSDAESAVYADLLREMIAAWRETMQDKQLPFAIVQIHDYQYRDYPAWHRIQEAQAAVAAADERAALIVTKDVCEHDQIHPLKKQEVAHRVVKVLLKWQE